MSRAEAMNIYLRSFEVSPWEAGRKDIERSTLTPAGQRQRHPAAAASDQHNAAAGWDIFELRFSCEAKPRGIVRSTSAPAGAAAAPSRGISSEWSPVGERRTPDVERLKACRPQRQHTRAGTGIPP
jgi:hypothetical protein